MRPTYQMLIGTPFIEGVDGSLILCAASEPLQRKGRRDGSVQASLSGVSLGAELHSALLRSPRVAARPSAHMYPILRSAAEGRKTVMSESHSTHLSFALRFAAFTTPVRRTGCKSGKLDGRSPEARAVDGAQGDHGSLGSLGTRTFPVHSWMLKLSKLLSLPGEDRDNVSAGMLAPARALIMVAMSNLLASRMIIIKTKSNK